MLQEHQSYVFISYIREDLSDVGRIVTAFQNSGVPVALDRDKLFPGMFWQDAIRKTIRDGNYFLACFSRHYDPSPETDMNEELTIAIEELRRYSINYSWFIPVLLSECDVPNIPIGTGKTLRDLHWCILYEDWNIEINSLLDAVHRTQVEQLRTKNPRLSIEGSFSQAIAIAADRLLRNSDNGFNGNKAERVAGFIELVADSLEDSMWTYVSTDKGPHMLCGEIKTLLWATKQVADTVEDYWLRNTMNRTRKVLWKYVSGSGWGGVAEVERADEEIMPLDVLEDLTDQLRDIARWIRSNI